MNVRCLQTAQLVPVVDLNVNRSPHPKLAEPRERVVPGLACRRLWVERILREAQTYQTLAMSDQERT